MRRNFLDKDGFINNVLHKTVTKTQQAKITDKILQNSYVQSIVTLTQASIFTMN